MRRLICLIRGHDPGEEGVARVLRLMNLRERGEYPIVCERCGQRFLTMTMP